MIIFLFVCRWSVFTDNLDQVTCNQTTRTRFMDYLDHIRDKGIIMWPGLSRMLSRIIVFKPGLSCLGQVVLDSLGRIVHIPMVNSVGKWCKQKFI